MINAELKTEAHNINFHIRRSIRYHDRRRKFFDALHMATNVAALLLGSAVIAAILKDAQIVGMTAGALVSVLVAVDLVHGHSKMACLHSLLLRRFMDLEKEMVLKDPSEEELRIVKTKILDIETDEPPVKKVLDSICQNELLRAMGYGREEFLQITWYQRMFAQFIDIMEYRITKADQRVT